jgi:O-antigen ligase
MALADRALGFAAPALLLLSIVLGGASHRAAGVPANALLQGLAVILIVFVVATRRAPLTADGVRPLLLIGALWLLIGLVFLVPLPYDMWSSLPGRDAVVQGLAAVGVPESSSPISMAPYESLNSLMRLLPATAMFLLTLQLSYRDRRRLVFWFMGMALVSICLGIAQLAGGEASGLRFYTVTNPNMPVGFFANGNHQATLLLCALAYCGFLLARGARKSDRKDRAVGMFGGIMALFFTVGIAIVGSLTGYGLLIPVAAGVALIYRKAVAGVLSWLWIGAVGAVFVAALALAFVGPFSNQDVADQLGESSTSRRVIAETTVQAIGDHLPVGTGLATFAQVYRLYEDPSLPRGVYVNHAHNDFLEVALETGVFGILLMLAFLAWFGRRAWVVWRTDREGANLARAATLAIVAVLGFSLVEYPLRTSAMAVIFAMSCAFLLPARASSRSKSRSSKRSQSPAAGAGLRHMEAT